jgi:hypothetical protein
VAQSLRCKTYTNLAEGVLRIGYTRGALDFHVQFEYYEHGQAREQHTRPWKEPSVIKKKLVDRDVCSKPVSEILYMLQKSLDGYRRCLVDIKA